MKKSIFQRSRGWLPFGLLLFLPVFFLSCIGDSPEDQVVLSFQLDSAKLGNSDSLRFEIYNGKAPGPGDTAKPVQVFSIKTPKDGGRTVNIKLSGQVESDFSMLVIAFDSTGAAQRKLFEFDDFNVDKDVPPVVLLAVITAVDLEMRPGETKAAALTLKPDQASDKRVVFTSSDSSVVQVVGAGRDSLKAIADGTAKVTVTAQVGGAKDTFEVTVSRRLIPLKGIEVKDMRALVDDQVAVEPVFDPADATNRDFTLASKDTTIAVVSGNSVVAKGLGRVELEAVAADGGHKATFSFTVERPRFDPDVKSITTSKCAPCHIPPAALDWGDSALFVKAGVDALRRITRPDGDKDKMPIAGAPNGPLTTRQLNILVDWLNRVVIPVKGVSVTDMTVNLGDTVNPAPVFDPPTATNQDYVLVSQDTALAPVRGKVLVPEKVGQTTVQVNGLEGGRTLSFKLTVAAPDFAKNLKPIIQVKCFPCHTTGALNWVDSVNFLNSGQAALIRLQLPVGDSLRMPLAGAPNGDLTAQQLRVILGWLQSKVIPLKGFTVGPDSLRVGSRKAPVVTFDPPNANNKAFALHSPDTSILAIEGDEMVGRKIGTVSVQIRALENDETKSFDVKVLPVPVDSVHGVDTAGAVGDTVMPRVLFFPENSSNQDYAISLPNASTVVKLDGTRKVVGLAVGVDTLLVSSTDGGKVAAFRFTVGPVLPKTLSVPDTNGTSSGTDLVTPRLIWTPLSTTNKAYTLSIPPADTSIAAVRGTQVLGKAIGVVNAVTATSVADTSVKATFKFTVGPVPVAGLSVASTVAVVGSTVSPAITWNPANASDKTFSLSVLVPNTANLSVSGNRILAQHLTTNGVVRVTSGSNASAFANWSVQVIRPVFTTSPARAVFLNRCGQCHVKGNAFGIQDWLDSTTVVGFRTGSTTVRHDSLIIARANPALDATSRMPPTYATNPAALSAADYKIIVDWLNAK